MLAFVIFFVAVARAETVSIIIDRNAAPRVEFGAEKLAEALKAVKLDGAIIRSEPKSGSKIFLVSVDKQDIRSLISLQDDFGYPKKEGFLLHSRNDKAVVIAGGDESGVLYGCLELARRIRELGALPRQIDFTDKPAMTLRGTCVAMQKTFILPGRKVYEYPYTPELFPRFYDKKLWTEYLDFLCANRMNTLYLWSGHPFASLVRLKDYPYAVEVPDEIFKKNQEQYRWLATECDKRGIWLVQMFYNIFVSKPFAETNGISTQLSASTPLVADYTRKSIAEFVKEFPNVGLMVCLGEALQGTSNQVEWATKTILPGVLDGLKSRAGVPPAQADSAEANARAGALAGQGGRPPYFEQPPVVIRTHAMDAEKIIPACFTVYSNLFTETKYNGESLTTYEPRGKSAETHRSMAKLGPHLVNVHILANLEPFRYGATEFIRKSMLASRDSLGASGIHLYPLSYWNWPYAPDIVAAEHTGETPVPLLQWNRDWIWFEAWARYAWNPDVNTNEDRVYWVGRLGDFYGCDTNAAGKILDAYNAAGEVAPMLIRRFGITEGNRQTLSLGMTLDQLVNPNKYGAIEDLWLSQAPPGERLDEYVSKEWRGELHNGETSRSVIEETLRLSRESVYAIEAADGHVKKNKAEFKRLQNDIHCIDWMGKFYSSKVVAAGHVLYHGHTNNYYSMERALKFLTMSVVDFGQLTELTSKTYSFANSMQTSHRKIPFIGAVKGVGTNYHWTQVLPLYQKELDDFRAAMAAGKTVGLETNAPTMDRKINPEIAEPQ